ncbi:MAG: hypothetical protein HOM16_10840 [Woeseia sp.]|nr:hypothetical protein [Woeseia sp.]
MSTAWHAGGLSKGALLEEDSLKLVRRAESCHGISNVGWHPRSGSEADRGVHS